MLCSSPHSTSSFKKYYLFYYHEISIEFVSKLNKKNTFLSDYFRNNSLQYSNKQPFNSFFFWIDCGLILFFYLFIDEKKVINNKG